MKEYKKPEVVYIDFSTEVVTSDDDDTGTGFISGEGSEDI